MDISESRKKINEIDCEIAKLFEERMHVSAGIASYKKQKGLPVYDPDREKEVLQSNSASISDDIIRSYYISFQKAVMDISKKYQNSLLKGLKIAYSGSVGAFAHIAARRIFGVGEYIPFPGFEKAFRSVEDGTCDVCVLPLENSFAGEVAQVNDLLFKGSLYISSVYDLAVYQCLCGVSGSDEKTIKRVVSHAQALSQCSEYIGECGFEAAQYENTASAALYVSDLNDIHTAAICSAECADLYGLKVLRSRINTVSNNTTRFIVLTRESPVADNVRTGEVRFTLMFTVKNEAGALAAVINDISGLGYNMTSIHSSPMKELPWNYYFRIECEGNPSRSDLDRINEILSGRSDRARLVGIYPLRTLD